MVISEQEFIESIDCRFPYHDVSKWKTIIQTAISISANAAFMVLHEACRPPRSSAVSPKLQKIIFEHWRGQFSHPLVPIVSESAIALIERRELSVADVLETMTAVADYPGQYNALSVVYFSCDDIDGKVDELYERVIQKWALKAPSP